MSNEFKHASVGAELSQAEWEAVNTHIADGQTNGDILYFDGTNWKRRPYNIGAHVYNSTNITIPTATWTVLTFNSELYDTDNIHDTSTNPSRLTCKTAGLYLITFNAYFVANTTGTRIFRLYLNGTTAIGQARGIPDALGYCAIPATTIYQLTVNDYVEAQVYQNSGGDLEVKANAHDTPEFMMQRMG